MVNTLLLQALKISTSPTGLSGYYVGKKELAFANSFFIVIIKKVTKSVDNMYYMYYNILVR